MSSSLRRHSQLLIFWCLRELIDPDADASSLDYFASLDDSFDFFHDRRANAHYEDQKCEANHLRSVAKFERYHTFFPNEAVISVIGIVRVSCDRTSPISHNSEVEFYHLLVRSLDGRRKGIQLPRNSWPNRPICPELSQI